MTLYFITGNKDKFEQVKYRLKGIQIEQLDLDLDEVQSIDPKEVIVHKLNEAKKYLAQGQFPAGSMGPKIQSAINFIERGGERVMIGAVEEMPDMIKGTKGTIITKK